MKPVWYPIFLEYMKLGMIRGDATGRLVYIHPLAVKKLFG